MDGSSLSQRVEKNYLQLALETMSFNVPSIENWTFTTKVEEDLIDPWTMISLTQPLTDSNSGLDANVKLGTNISSEVLENLDNKSYIVGIKRDSLVNYTIAYYIESMSEMIKFYSVVKCLI